MERGWVWSARQGWCMNQLDYACASATRLELRHFDWRGPATSMEKSLFISHLHRNCCAPCFALRSRWQDFTWLCM